MLRCDGIHCVCVPIAFDRDARQCSCARGTTCACAFEQARKDTWRTMKTAAFSSLQSLDFHVRSRILGNRVALGYAFQTIGREP